MKKILLTVLMISFCVFGLFAFDSYMSFFGNLSEGELDVLHHGDYLDARTNYGQSVYHLAPSESKAYEILKQAHDVPNSFTVGVLQFVEYPKKYENMTQEQMMLDVYNRMLQISTMKGIKYISATAGYKPKTLFTGATVIADPKKQTSMKDPSVKNLPSKANYYTCLTDTKFGKNVYCADYNIFSDEIYIEVTNYDVIRFMGVKCVEPKSLHLFVDVKFMEEGMAIIGYAIAYDTPETVQTLFGEVSLDGAFDTRIKALKDWFVERMAQ